MSKESYELTPGQTKTSEDAPLRLANKAKKSIELLPSPLPKCIKQVAYNGDFTPRIIIRLHEYTEAARHELNRFINEIRDVFRRMNLDLDRMYADQSEVRFRVTELTINDRTNWRRWLHYPQKFSPDIQNLLDDASAYIGQQKGTDAYSCFSAFINEAHRQGLITQQELNSIKNELHLAANGS